MSTATIHSAIEKMTREDAEVLAHYAAGETSRQISTTTGVDMETVCYALDALAGNSRERALGLVVQYRERHGITEPVKPASPAPAAKPTPPPASKPATPSPVVAAPQPKPAAKPATPPAPRPAVTVKPTPPTEDGIDGIVGLLDAADRTGNAKLTRAAAKIRELVADLQAQVTAHAHEQQLREEAAYLEARLAEIRDQLRVGADPKAVRKWAASNNIECPAFGRIPQPVLDAYNAAVA